MPGVTGVPGGMGTVPGGMGIMPGGMGIVPGGMGIVPGGTGIMPGGTGIVPGVPLVNVVSSSPPMYNVMISNTSPLTPPSEVSVMSTTTMQGVEQSGSESDDMGMCTNGNGNNRLQTQSLSRKRQTSSQTSTGTKTLKLSGSPTSTTPLSRGAILAAKISRESRDQLHGHMGLILSPSPSSGPTKATGQLVVTSRNPSPGNDPSSLNTKATGEFSASHGSRVQACKPHLKLTLNVNKSLSVYLWTPNSISIHQGRGIIFCPQLELKGILNPS